MRGFRAAGLPCAMPGGAFYVLADIRPTGLDDVTFAERLLAAKKVAVVPGSPFGRTSTGFVRVCYTVPEAKLREAVEKIGDFVAGL